MGGLTPLVVMILLEWFGLHWRGVFFVFAACGVGWCILFALWFRNRPEEKPAVNQAELELIRGERGPAQVHGGVPWRKILTSRSVWGLCLMYACGNYSWYFAMNYLPAYLQDHRGVARDSALGAIYKGGPLLLGFIGCFVGGWLTDRYMRRTGDKKWGRRIYGIFGHGLAGACMLSLLAIPYKPGYAWVFALAIALSGFFNDLTMASAWAACQDVGKRYSAIVSGTMNMIGNLGGALTTYLSALIPKLFIAHYAAAHALDPDTMPRELKHIASRPGYELNFLIYGAIYLSAIIFWLMIDASRSVDPGETAPAN
jgi:nitrate/nitrite transporter NarK